MTVTLRSSRELPSRPDGVLRGDGPAWEEPAAPRDVFSGPAHCPAPYTFSFEMLVTGPCLLAGLESPSHALRADAPPHASSAATICPHQPHLMLEAGSLSSAEYEAQVRARRDFQRLQRRDSEGDRQVWLPGVLAWPLVPLLAVLVQEEQMTTKGCPLWVEWIEKVSGARSCCQPRSELHSAWPRMTRGSRAQVWFLQRRFHKDILLNPVLVLSFCPDLSSKPGHLGTATRELLFLLDGSSMAHKACGSTVWAGLGLGAAVGLRSALDWALGQPQHRAHPRQLFLLTAASPMAAETHQTLELMRWHRAAARCFSFGLGPACRQLLQDLSALSRGQAYFLRPGERLQPMLVQALRKALEPALSDISVDWFVPDAVEALLTPREIPALYPGDQLLGYCSLLRVDGFRSHPQGVSLGWGVGVGADALTDPVTDPGPNPSSDAAIWRRIFQSSYIREQYVLTHCSASPEPGPGSTGSSESPTGALSAEVLGRRRRAALTGRSLSSPPGRVNSAPGHLRHPSLGVAPDGPGPEPGQLLGQGLDDSGSLLSPVPMDWDMLMEPPFLFTAVPPSGELAPPAIPLPPQPPRCHVVIRALCGEQPMSWEVGVGLEMLWGPRDAGSLPPSPPERESAWDQALHRLTAASVVRDNEQLALRGRGETRADRGELLVAPVRAQGACMGQRVAEAQTSKVSSAPSCFTCPVAVDATTREVLPSALQVQSSEPAEPPGTPPASQGHLDAAPLPPVVHSKGNTQIWGPPLNGSSSGLKGGSLAGGWEPDQTGNSSSALGDHAAPIGGPHRLPPEPPSRLSLGRRKARGPDSHRLCSPNTGQASDSNSEGSNHDYLPLVRLQEAPGSFRLDAPFCAAVHISRERLCRASPFAAHRASLSPTSASSPWALLGHGAGQGDSATASCSPSPSSGSEGLGQVDSGRGSDTEASEGAEGPGGADLRGRTWATAHLPDGLDLANLKAAARGLFLLLRHWDQNLQLHLLCYSPANM
ncbi:hypothetical protein E2I00_002978 [Balaenoptera physalus]|uniref:VWFA domain-containing protein n=1 Tax=Balaenoptera physalus TaxID=9770 RepID=A0A6A1Q4P9_BALPH|nr:hypothetical protein E2I00_002978 [Balaenoptera physalus]